MNSSNLKGKASVMTLGSSQKLTKHGPILTTKWDLGESRHAGTANIDGVMKSCSSQGTVSSAGSTEQTIETISATCSANVGAWNRKHTLAIIKQQREEIQLLQDMVKGLNESLTVLQADHDDLLSDFDAVNVENDRLKEDLDWTFKKASFLASQGRKAMKERDELAEQAEQQRAAALEASLFAEMKEDMKRRLLRESQGREALERKVQQLTYECISKPPEDNEEGPPQPQTDQSKGLNLRNVAIPSAVEDFERSLNHKPTSNAGMIRSSSIGALSDSRKMFQEFAACLTSSFPKAA